MLIGKSLGQKMLFWIIEVFMILFVVDIKIGNLFVVEIRTAIEFGLFIHHIVPIQ